MSPTRIEEEKEDKEETFKSIKETNLPLLGSGATAYVRLDSRGPTNSRSQGNSEIVITEFNREFDRLLSIGALQQ